MRSFCRKNCVRKIPRFLGGGLGGGGGKCRFYFYGARIFLRKRNKALFCEEAHLAGGQLGNDHCTGGAEGLLMAVSKRWFGSNFCVGNIQWPRRFSPKYWQYSLSSERRGTKSTAMQIGGVLQYKLEVYCDSLLKSSGGWGFWHSPDCGEICIDSANTWCIVFLPILKPLTCGRQSWCLDWSGFINCLAARIVVSNFPLFL